MGHEVAHVLQTIVDVQSISKIRKLSRYLVGTNSEQCSERLTSFVECEWVAQHTREQISVSKLKLRQLKINET